MKWLRWFIAGALAVPLFHQVMLLLFYVAGWVPRAPYAMAATRPFGVPQVISLAFWGGVWGLLLGVVLLRRSAGAAYWLTAVVFGAVFPTLVALFVAAPLKGQPVRFSAKIALGGFLLNGAWGIGTALLERVMRAFSGARSA